MRKEVVLVWIAGFCLSMTSGYAQIQKQFSVGGDRNVEEVKLHFSVNAGMCSIKAGDGNEALTVYSNKDHTSYSHTFDKSIEGNLCKINLELDDNQNHHGLGHTISSRVFGTEKDHKGNLWRVYLNRTMAYDMDLAYGMGEAVIDLSGVAVSNVKIHTASADVNVGYFSDAPNTILMDTFAIKVDMGSIAVKKLHLANSKYVKADVGFGDLLLDLTGEMKNTSQVHGSVGAGNLFILLPEEQRPMIVRVHDSWLCQVKLSESFQPHGENTFVNEAYAENSEDVIEFVLDVSMGKIIFKER